MTHIIKVNKNSDNDIEQVMLDNGQILDMDAAIALADSGKIDGVNVGTAKNGRKFLRANPNDKKEDNLNYLPTFD